MIEKKKDSLMYGYQKGKALFLLSFSRKHVGKFYKEIPEWCFGNISENICMKSMIYTLNKRWNNDQLIDEFSSDDCFGEISEINFQR